MQEDIIIPYGYCQCGCGQKVGTAPHNNISKGWVKGQPKTFLPYHKPPRNPIPYTIDPETGCWNWQGFIRKDGYAESHRQGKLWLMHRYYYEQKYGKHPKKYELDHLCRNRRCVNPDHLEPVLRVINIQRGAKTKLTPDQVREIRVLKGKQSARMVGQLYGVTPEMIYQIWLRHSWKNLE